MSNDFRTSPRSTKHTSPKTPKSMTRPAVAAFIRALAAANPEAETELAFRNTFELLISVVLSAQATDKSVNKATKALFEAAPDAARMAALGEDRIGFFIRTIGLWRNKARNVALLSQQLLDRHHGDVPNDRAALEALPGVGRKTANVVMNVAFGADTMAVDTHIFRIGNRTGLAPGQTTRQVEDGLVARIPRSLLRPAHHWLILHGRYVCKARRPECSSCAGAQWCLFPEKTVSTRTTSPKATSPKAEIS